MAVSSITECPKSFSVPSLDNQAGQVSVKNFQGALQKAEDGSKVFKGTGVFVRSCRGGAHHPWTGVPNKQPIASWLTDHLSIFWPTPPAHCGGGAKESGEVGMTVKLKDSVAEAEIIESDLKPADLPTIHFLAQSE